MANREVPFGLEVKTNDAGQAIAWLVNGKEHLLLGSENR